MGIIENVKDAAALGLPGPCSICGNNSVAYWQGEEVIRVCRWCAIDILPKLIGDAVVGNQPIERTLTRDWQHAKGEYYYAAALALEYERHKQHGD